VLLNGGSDGGTTMVLDGNSKVVLEDGVMRSDGA